MCEEVGFGIFSLTKTLRVGSTVMCFRFVLNLGLLQQNILDLQLKH